MNRTFKTITLALLCCLLSACLLPEQFEAKVTLAKNGSYFFSYQGTLIHAQAYAAAQKGELTAKDEEAHKQDMLKLAREAGYSKIEYQGKGKYKVQVEKSGQAEESYAFASKDSKFFAIVPQIDGTLMASGPRLETKALQDLQSLNTKLDGQLTITVESGAKVVKHNAHSEPSIFGMFGDRQYKWHIKSAQVPPFIVVQPAS